MFTPEKDEHMGTKGEMRRGIFGMAVLAVLLLLALAPALRVQAAVVDTPRIKNVKTRTAECQRVIWTSVSKAGGYQVACRAGYGSYRYKSVSGGKTVRMDLNSRLPNVMYTYKVRAYRTVKKKRVYGSWSAPVQAYLNKDEAIYGREVPYETYGRFYKSAAASYKDMRPVTVKTWDFASGKKGRKITRTWTIYVHKNLAGTVKRAFNEIYKGSEKFPIHALGGWRSGSGRSEHYDGTAIDINPEENYQVVNGQAVVGRYWKPKKDPYSIPKNGEVARILRKYGFSQGIWSTSQDYMHFSYFGT